MSKNKEVAEELRNFAEYVSKWNIPGIDKIYKKVIEVTKEIIRKLELSDEGIEIVENIESRFETLLATDIYYREHFVHQFQVFQVGYYIINKNKRIQDALVGYLREKGCSGDEKKVLDDVIKCWFLTSMFHDLAYSTERIPIWLPDYLKTIFLPTSDSEEIPYIFSFDISRVGKYDYSKAELINLIGDKLKLSNGERPALYRHINDFLLEQKNHGILSALILLNRLEFEDDTNKLINYEAALSIAFHTKDVYELHTRNEYINSRSSRGFKLTFDAFPFAFLLMFCDNAQEWGRPFMRLLLDQRVNDQRVKVTLEDIIVNEKVITAILRYSGSTEEIEKIKSKIPKPEEFWSPPKDMQLFIHHKVNDQSILTNSFV